MRILGITAEYNPFHNGHRYHLEKSMENTGAEYSVAVMSGSFTQRGEAAVLDKWSRSRIAVENGVDLVLELPFIFACSRAEVFASGAIDILTGIGATHISFGSESGDLHRLEAVVQKLSKYKDNINEIRQLEMKKGYSSVKAFQKGVERILSRDEASLMTEPNNILAIEYLKRISYWREKGHAVTAHVVKRFGSGYREYNELAGFAGASVLREMIREGAVRETVLRELSGIYSAAELVRVQNPRQVEERAFLLLKGELMKSGNEEMARIHCMGEGLENKFRKEIVKASSMDHLVSAMVSKRYTESTVRRLIIYILIGLKEYNPQKNIYARVLAAGEKGRRLIKLIKKQENPHIPIITNINKEKDLYRDVEETLKYDIISSDVYNVINARDLYIFSDKVMKPYIV